MARRVVRDTYAYETVSPDGYELRRFVFAGSLVPDHYRLEDDGAAVDAELPDTSPQYSQRPGMGSRPRAEQVADDKHPDRSVADVPRNKR